MGGTGARCSLGGAATLPPLLPLLRCRQMVILLRELRILAAAGVRAVFICSTQGSERSERPKTLNQMLASALCCAVCRVVLVVLSCWVHMPDRLPDGEKIKHPD